MNPVACWQDNTGPGGWQPIRGWIAVWGHLVAAGGESALFVFFAVAVFRPRFPGEIRQLLMAGSQSCLQQTDH